MSPFYQGEVLPSMFSTTDSEYHHRMKKPVAQLFSMTNMRNFEPHAEECTAIFTEAMKEREGQRIGLSTWLQYYAFDVIACISFRRRFGFLEEQRDVDGMMHSLHKMLSYIKLIGVFPEWHPWLLGNRMILRLVETTLPPDPLSRFLLVRTLLRFNNEY